MTNINISPVKLNDNKYLIQVVLKLVNELNTLRREIEELKNVTSN